MGGAMSSVGRIELLVGALLLSVGIGSGGYFIGQTMYNARVAINTAAVKGLAERRVKADRAYWKIEYKVAGNDKAEVPKLYEQSEADQKQIITLLIQSGFEESEISPGVIR